MTVKAEHKDSLLLLLLKEKFGDFPPAKEWLEQKGVPFSEWRWS